MSPLRILAGVPGVWKALALVGTIFLTGLGIGFATAGWQKLPTRVAALEVIADTIRQEHQDVHEELRRVRLLIQQQLCLSVAEKERTPWQRCITQ